MEKFAEQNDEKINNKAQKQCEKRNGVKDYREKTRSRAGRLPGRKRGHIHNGEKSIWQHNSFTVVRNYV